MTVTTDPRKTGVALSAAIGSGTFAQMKAVTGMADGDCFLVTNYGRGGSLWRYSSTASDWFPVSPCKVYENTALITGIQQAADQLLLAIPMEAALLANKVFRVLVAFGKNGTTDSSGTFSFRMGANGTTADAQVASVAGSLGAANRSVGYDLWMRMASATSVEKLGGAPFSPWISGTGASGTLLNAATTVSTVASANFITLTTTMSGATDKPQLGYVALEVQP